jgi:N-acetylglucosaminyl-diphospho-decaprenol L-rhamnosyltransferase
VNQLARSLQVEPAQASPPQAATSVSVVMVVYMTGPALLDSLTQVLAEPLVDEFVIVDNGSPPEVAQALRELGRCDPRVQLLQGHGNVGFARGANLGAAAARGNALVFLNPDAFLQPGCIGSLLQASRRQPSPCVVGACVLNLDGSEQRGARRGEVTPVTTLMSFSQLSLMSPALRRFEIHREDEPAPVAATPTPTISGACFHVSQADFGILGGFDEGYFLHVEDIDLCWRARRIGGTVLFDPGARVVHVGSTSLTHPVFVEFHKGCGLVRYFIKRADTPWRWMVAWGLAPLILLAAVSRPALRAITGPRRGRPESRPRG